VCSVGMVAGWDWVRRCRLCRGHDGVIFLQRRRRSLVLLPPSKRRTSTHIHIHIYTHTHTYTHTLQRRRPPRPRPRPRPRWCRHPAVLPGVCVQAAKKLIRVGERRLPRGFARCLPPPFCCYNYYSHTFSRCLSSSSSSSSSSSFSRWQ